MITNEMIVKAAEEANRILLKNLPEETSCVHVFSNEFEKKMTKVTRRANHPFIYRFFRNVAVIILVVILGTSAFLTINTEAREKVFGWIKEQFGTLTSYYFEQESSETENVGRYKIGMLPKEYKEVTKDVAKESAGFVYDDGSGKYLKFGYIGEFDNMGLYLAVEDYEKLTAKVGVYAADVYISNNVEESNAIVWIDEKEGVLFYIGGFWEKEELIQMAESVRNEKE